MNEVIEAAPRAIEVKPAAAVEPSRLLQIAVEQGADIDKLTRLMELQERWEASAARKAFNVAFAAFKAEGVRIVKNIDVKDGPLKGKRYADLFAVVDTLTPVLSRHGLSASWRLTKDERDWLEVTCVLAHVGGHAETVSMGGPPDAGGAKNQIQARASCQSYLRRYTFLAITGMAAADEDDDGNGGAAAHQAQPAQEQRPEPKAWPADAFAAQFPRWTKAVEAGMKTTAEILAMARSRGTLSQEQEAQINAIKTPAVEVQE